MAKKAKNGNNKAVQDQQSIADILAKDTGAGYEEADSTSYAIPFLQILQTLSPACDKDEPTYVKGAKPGMIINTVTRQLFDIVVVQPIHYRKTFIEWVLRENGGGFRGEHEPAVGRELQASSDKNDKGQFILPSGNQLSETSNHYVMFESGEGIWAPALISMASTQLKASRMWMSNMKSATIETSKGPVPANMFAYTWVLGTEKQSNDKGKWYGWTFERLEQVDTIEMIINARSTREAVALNRITYNREQDDTTESNAL